MTWFEWKDKLLETFKTNAVDIGVEPDSIIIGSQAQISPCINIHLTPGEAEGARLTTGAQAAGKMFIQALVTVPGTMDDAESQDDAMRIGIQMAKHKPAGTTFTGIYPVAIFDANNKITDICSVSVEFNCLYNL